MEADKGGKNQENCNSIINKKYFFKFFFEYLLYIEDQLVKLEVHSFTGCSPKLLDLKIMIMKLKMITVLATSLAL